MSLEALSKPVTLKEKALMSLREAITLGTLKPGERLIERKLCEQLNVSRTVIRECIRHLDSEHLVETIPNTGPRVAQLAMHEVEEIYALRALLEGDAVASCCLQKDSQLIDKLEQLLDDISLSLKHGEILPVLDFTTEFYAIIFDAGNKSVSWDLVSRLNGRISRLRAMTLSSAGRETSGPKSLRAIVAAIKNGNQQKAIHACHHHLESAKEIAMELLANELSIYDYQTG